MNRKTVSGIMLALLLISMLTLTFNIQPVKASGTIYIRADGRVDPPTPNITTVDNVTYTFNGNIDESIVVERSNIIIDGKGYTVQGSGSGNGFSLSNVNNVTIEDTNITSFSYGVYLYGSSYGNSISGNNITANNGFGVFLYVSSSNSISGNNITANNRFGVFLYVSSSNSISGNNIANNWDGVYLSGSSNGNSISGNNITNNYRGIYVWHSSNNIIYHNNFIDNSQQSSVGPSGCGYANVWDDGYPSGGNYWSDYEGTYPDAEELDGSGIWDTPYYIDETNQDNYPLMEPWTSLPRTIGELKAEIEELGSEDKIDNQGIVTSLLAKLNVAQKLIDDAKIDQAKKILNAFINGVQAQSGKYITPEAAELLIESAECILSQL